MKLEAIVARIRKPTKKERENKQAEFLEAWSEAGYPDPFEYKGHSHNPIPELAAWFREQQQKARQGRNPLDYAFKIRKVNPRARRGRA